MTNKIKYSDYLRVEWWGTTAAMEPFAFTLHQMEVADTTTVILPDPEDPHHPFSWDWWANRDDLVSPLYAWQPDNV